MAEFTKNIARWYDSTIAGRHKIEACDFIVDAANLLVRAHENISGGHVNSIEAVGKFSAAAKLLNNCQEMIAGLTKERFMFGQTVTMVGSNTIPSKQGVIDLKAVVKQFGNEGEITRMTNNLATKLEQLADDPHKYFQNTPALANELGELIGKTIGLLAILDPGKTRLPEVARAIKIAQAYQEKLGEQERAAEDTAAAKLN